MERKHLPAILSPPVLSWVIGPTGREEAKFLVPSTADDDTAPCNIRMHPSQFDGCLRHFSLTFVFHFAKLSCIMIT